MKRRAIKLRVHKSGTSYSYIVTIPKALVELSLKWKKGDELAIEEVKIKRIRGVFIYKMKKDD